jgi:hypothetical protein
MYELLGYFMHQFYYHTVNRKTTDKIKKLLQ